MKIDNKALIDFAYKQGFKDAAQVWLLGNIGKENTVGLLDQLKQEFLRHINNLNETQKEANEESSSSL